MLVLFCFIVKTVQDSCRLWPIQFTPPDATNIDGLVASASIYLDTPLQVKVLRILLVIIVTRYCTAGLCMLRACDYTSLLYKSFPQLGAFVNVDNVCVGLLTSIKEDFHTVSFQHC